VDATALSAAATESQIQPDLESLFTAHYREIARLIASIVHDRARAEELAVEVFLQWTASSHHANPKAWLFRAATHVAIDEIRRRVRRERYDRLLGRFLRRVPTPEEVHLAKEEQQRVRAVLASMTARQSELLLLRAQGFAYDELASTLNLNPLSVGKLLSRAQQTFRKEYLKKYGSD
jgi:RNA polymerase sigma-70 factor (ECF subfamily)